MVSSAQTSSWIGRTRGCLVATSIVNFADASQTSTVTKGDNGHPSCMPKCFSLGSDGCLAYCTTNLRPLYIPRILCVGYTPSPAASQPLIKKLWLGFGPLPCNAGGTGIEMVNSFHPLSGDCPLKQSKGQRLLRLKKGAEARKKYKKYRSAKDNNQLGHPRKGTHRFLLSPEPTMPANHFLQGKFVPTNAL